MKKSFGCRLLIFLATFWLCQDALLAADLIYWSTPTDIRYGNRDGSGTPASLASGESSPCGVALSPANGRIYWADTTSGAIKTKKLDGTGAVSTLFTDSAGVCGVAVDTTASKIYWANPATDLILVGNLDGTGSISTLFTETIGSGPTAVAIDHANAKIYWANETTGEIRRGNSNGTGATTLFTDANQPSGVAVYASLGKVYWTDYSSGAINNGNSDGTGATTTLVSSETTPFGIAADGDDNRLYWSNFSTGAIRFSDLAGAGASDLFTGEISPSFAAVLKGPLLLAAPANTSAGGNVVGATLSCSQGTWTGDSPESFLYRAPTSYAYQWQRNGVDIVSATSSTYIPTQRGSYTCVVAAVNQAGSQTSPQSNAITIACRHGSLKCK